MRATQTMQISRQLKASSFIVTSIVAFQLGLSSASAANLPVSALSEAAPSPALSSTVGGAAFIFAKGCQPDSFIKRCNELGSSPLLLADRGADERSSVLLERSQKAYAEQRYPEAAGWLKSLLQSDPGNAKAHDLLGLIYHRTDKLPAAEAEYRKAIEANPKLVEARYNLGISLFDQKKYKEAEKYLEEAAAKQSNSEYEYNLGLTCQKLNKTDKAIQAYQRAIKVDSSNALAHYSLGRLYHDNQKIQDAIQEYKKAIEIDSAYADAHNNLGVAYGDLGQYPESIAEFQLALKYNPNLPQAQQNLGFSQAHTTLGMTYFKKGDFDKAFEEYKKSLSIDPYYADAYYNLALLYQEKNNLKAAIEHYQFAIKLAPDNAKAHNNLGVAYAKTGRPDLASSEYKQALKLEPSYKEAQANLAALSREH